MRTRTQMQTWNLFSGPTGAFWRVSLGFFGPKLTRVYNLQALFPHTQTSRGSWYVKTAERGPRSRFESSRGVARKLGSGPRSLGPVPA